MIAWKIKLAFLVFVFASGSALQLAPASRQAQADRAPGIRPALPFSAFIPDVTMPVALTINRVDAHCDPEASGQDFYAKIEIGDLSFSTADDAGDDDNSIQPNWSFSNPEVDVTDTNLQITISIWEMDGGWPFNIDPDDRVDIHPDADKTWILIFYNAVTGEWSVEEGEIGPDDDQPAAHRGVWRGANGDDCAEIEFDISNSFTGDQDQDGLLDTWEQFGIDTNGDGIADIDLPALGADPLHKDIFIEVDWMAQPAGAGAHSHEPLQVIWPPIWHAFDDAPVANPDDTTGIHLHIDTGSLYSSGAGGSYDCDGDGISLPGDMDCDLDGIIDIGDLGELSNPPLPGGGKLRVPETQFLDFRGDGEENDFFRIKDFHFLAMRLPVFHYAVFSHSLNLLRPLMSGRAEIFGNDINVTLGARNGPVSPINGLNVVGFLRQQAGTFMHELGHNLNLRHGGADDVQWKPNYLSVMNYDHQMNGVLGLAPNIGLDYSPNQLPVLTGSLDENNLDECIPWMTLAWGVTTAWSIPGFGILNAPAFGTASFVDWNNDNGGAADDGVNCASANIAANLNPRFTIGEAQTVLTGHDDWTGGDMRLDFRHSGEFENGAPLELAAELELAEEMEIDAARPDFIELTSPDQLCSSHATLTFDGFPAGTLIANQYPGVHFLDPGNMDAKTRDFASRGAATISPPNSLFAYPIPGPSSFGITLDILFDAPQRRVGVFLGNGGAGGTAARLRAYDAGLNLIGEVNDTVHTPVTEFLGIQSFAAGIQGVRIDFPLSSLAEEIDNLVFDACLGDPLPPTAPSAPFSYTARAVRLSRQLQDAENMDITLTPLDGLPLTINGAGHNTPHTGQAARGEALNLFAPAQALGPAGQPLVFHHWKMDEFLSFADFDQAVSVPIDHNAVFTAVYYQIQTVYLPLAVR